MAICIKLSNCDISCTFDKYGNVYLSLFENPEEIYDLNISNTNNLFCEKYTISEKKTENTSPTLNIGELIPFYNNTTLRGKIIKDYLDDDYSDNDSDNEFTEDIQKKYWPEDLEFNEYMDKRINTNEPYFSFNLNTHKNDLENKLIYDREHIHALYDTLIYEGNLEVNTLLMKTSLVNDIPLYRLSIFTSGDILFRAIGSTQLHYKILFDKEQGLMLKLI